MTDNSVGLGPYQDKVQDQLYDDDGNTVDPVTSKIVATPPVTNERGYIPYRGNEQHGVRFLPDSEGQSKYSKYAAEQKAFEDYTDPQVTPRDLVPAKPLAVEITNNPDLLNVRESRIRTVLIPANSGPIPLIPKDWNRTHLIIAAYAATATTFYLKTKDDGNATLDAWPVPIAAGATVTALTAQSTGAFWGSAGANDVQVVLYTEYPVHDGKPLIDRNKVN